MLFSNMNFILYKYSGCVKITYLLSSEHTKTETGGHQHPDELTSILR
jgi:hypothetical protein